MKGVSRRSDMKLLVLLLVAALAACDYAAPEAGVLKDSYSTPDKADTVEESAAPIEPGKSFFSFKNVYHGAFPPARFPPNNFLSPITYSSFNYPLRTFNLAASPQGILPPISQIIPPQISQIVPPISQIVPPIFGNAKPALPVPSPIVPPQVFPPQVLPPVSQPLFTKFAFPYFRPPTQFSYNFPSAFSFPPAGISSLNFFPQQLQKQPAVAPTEPLSSAYGPPASTPVEPEPAGPAESSAPFEPSPVSFPYEPAAPEEPESAAPHKPAQEYGIPSSK